MKKILLTAFTVTAAISAITIYQNQIDKVALSPLTLANVEALTNGNEDGKCKACHWYITYLSLNGSYRCDDGGSTVCVAMWPY